jgi:hypothetical protein
MYSPAALRSLPDPTMFGADVVTSVGQLRRDGWTGAAIRSQLRARRWQRIGRALVRHNGQLAASERREVALVQLGPRAVLTSFTALEDQGLQTWERDEIHVLVPRGARVRRTAGLPVAVHYTDRWDELPKRGGVFDGPAHASLLAASSFKEIRPACAILAACVQQRLLMPADLIEALDASVRLRHRRGLLAAAHDIGQGAEALSEIDFARLCRRFGLPAPLRQAIRVQADGRRRYVDAEWISRTGRRIVAEVDGALHLIPRRWWDDQLRQNELAIAGDLVLRFPTVLMRAEPKRIADQLRRAIDL